jgi:hypothetical protein
MGQGEQQLGLTGVLGQAGNLGEQHGATGDGLERIVGIGHEHRALPDSDVVRTVGEVQSLPTSPFLGLALGQYAACDTPTQYHHAPLDADLVVRRVETPCT